MASKRNVSEFLAAGRIQAIQGSLAVADVDLVLSGVVANVIGVAGEMHGRKRLVGFAVKDPAGTVVSVGDEQFVDFGDKENSLGFSKPGDGGEPFAFAEVEYFEGVVTQSRNEQALPLNVDAQMVDAPFHVGKREGLDLTQDARLGGLRRSSV